MRKVHWIVCSVVWSGLWCGSVSGCGLQTDGFSSTSSAGGGGESAAPDTTDGGAVGGSGGSGAAQRPDGGVDAPTGPDAGIEVDAGAGSSPDAAEDEDTGTGTQPGALYVGFRSSSYGLNPRPSPQYFSDTAKHMAAQFPGSKPAGLWIVGVIGSTECLFEFPSDGTYLENATFSDEDIAEPYFDHFDQEGISIWIQIEPGDVDVVKAIRLTLDRYHHHPCVVGFGVDNEWLERSTYEWGRPVTDDDARLWLATVREYNPSYTLFLKHWEPDMMPPTERDGLIFIDDAQGFWDPGLDTLVSEFQKWGAAFPSGTVAFQYGYPADKHWWEQLDHPFVDIGQRLTSIPNNRGLFWVDFSLYDIYPPY